MFRFFAMYCIVAAACAVGIWKGVPVLKSEFYGRMYSGEHVAEGDDLIFVLPPELQAQDQESAPDTAASAEAPTPEPRRVWQPIDEAPKKLPSYWGILKETVNGFTASGEVGGKIPGATIIEQVSRHASDAGTMIKCRVLRSKDQQWVEDVFIPESALVIFRTPYADVPQENRDLVVKCFTLRTQIADRRNSFREAAIKANPHFTAYQTAARSVITLQRQSKELVEQRDTATGLRRNQINDQLRKLKSEEALLLRKLRDVEVVYKKWRDSHDDGSMPARNDEQIKSWTAELTKIEPEARYRMGMNW